MGVKGLTPKHQYAHSPQCPIFISYDKLSRRISLTIKTFLSWRLLFLFSWPHCLIQWQYSAKICQNCQINSADYAYINLTRNREFHQADFAWRIWLKFTKIIKSINIHFGRQNFVKSAIFITARISGHMQYIEEKLEANNSKSLKGSWLSFCYSLVMKCCN